NRRLPRQRPRFVRGILPIPKPLPAAVAVTVLLALPAASVRAAPPPAIGTKEAQARSVLAQIASIDRELGRTAEEWNGARYELALVRGQLAQTRTQLVRARRQDALARRRVAQRLVELYTSPSSSTVDVMLGAA